MRIGFLRHEIFITLPVRPLGVHHPKVRHRSEPTVGP
jgi:hypothetical protein